NKLIIFILPTKALLEEYLIDLKSILNEKGVKDINVSKSVSQVDKESKNILVFTQERYNSFLYEKSYDNMDVDFLFIDEAHKVLDKKNNRAITLYKVINNSIEKYGKLKVIFSCPVISNPDVFFKTFNIPNSKKTRSLCIKESPVNQDLYFANYQDNNFVYFDSILNKKINFNVNNAYQNDFEIIRGLAQQSKSNLIYVSSKTECIRKCNEFLEYLIREKKYR
ncbi:DEAD/DEAH box helicase, partial [Escherichia coli]